MTDELTPARLEANLRTISLVVSRLAPVMMPEFEPFSRALYEARPAIGVLVWKDRHVRDLSRERYAARFNLPLDMLVTIERWRLIKEPADVEA